MWQTLGFDKIKKYFEAVMAGDQLGHAYVFSGQEMIGKKTFALELAAKLAGGPDILATDPSSSDSGRTITIEAIRNIKNWASLSPYAGLRKVIIIDDAHLMTVEAQNALLKQLEEPSPSSLLILVTANPESLLPTIGSRCQEVKFASHSRNLINQALKDAKLSRANSEFLADFANGRIGLVMSVLRDDAFDEVKNSVEELMKLVKLDINGRLMAAQKLTDDKNRSDLPRKVLYWLLYSRMRLTEPRAVRVARGLLGLYRTISQPQFNQRLALENFLINFG